MSEKQTPTTEPTSVDVRDEILKHLSDIERNLAWLARKCDFGYNALYQCFNYRHFDLTDDKLSKINEVLDTKFQK